MSEGILVSPAMTAHHRVFVMADALRSALANEAEYVQHGAHEGEEEEEEDAHEEAAAAAAAAGAADGALDMV